MKYVVYSSEILLLVRFLMTLMFLHKLYLPKVHFVKFKMLY